jgi:hypothetical protein
MTLPSPFVVDPGLVAVGRQSQPRMPRRPPRPVLTGAITTVACVAGAFGLAMQTLPPLQTPGRVAQTFVEARYAEDSPAAWDLICRAGRDAHGGYTAFTERLAYMNEYYMTPSYVNVEIEGLKSVSEPGAHGFSVAYRVTSDERPAGWAERGEALVIQEDGELRVCIADRSPELG